MTRLLSTVPGRAPRTAPHIPRHGARPHRALAAALLAVLLTAPPAAFADDTTGPTADTVTDVTVARSDGASGGTTTTGGHIYNTPYCAAASCGFAGVPDGTVVTARAVAGQTVPVSLLAFNSRASAHDLRALAPDGTPAGSRPVGWYAHAADDRVGDADSTGTADAATDAGGFATIGWPALPAGPVSVQVTGSGPLAGQDMPAHLTVVTASAAGARLRLFNQAGEPLAGNPVRVDYAAVAFAAPATAGRPRLGLHQDLTYFDGGEVTRRAGLAAGVGATVTRTTVRWDRTEPADGTFDWTQPDLVARAARAAGMEPLWVLHGTPRWLGSGGNQNLVPAFGTAAFDQWSRKLAEFAGAAARRYPGSRWEVWNEPNERFFWQPTPDRRAYSAAYRAARAAILGADPTAQVGVGGITGLGAGCCLQGLGFLAEMIRAGDPIDHVGVHPYAGDNQAPDACVAGERNFRDAWDVRALLDANGLSRATLWLTEFGWPDGGDPGAMTPAKQAAHLDRALAMATGGDPQRGCQPGAPAVRLNADVLTVFFDLDTPDYPSWGIFDEGGNRKPAADVFARWANIHP